MTTVHTFSVQPDLRKDYHPREAKLIPKIPRLYFRETLEYLLHSSKTTDRSHMTLPSPYSQRFRRQENQTSWNNGSYKCVSMRSYPLWLNRKRGPQLAWMKEKWFLFLCNPRPYGEVTETQPLREFPRTTCTRALWIT